MSIAKKVDKKGGERISKSPSFKVQFPLFSVPNFHTVKIVLGLAEFPQESLRRAQLSLSARIMRRVTFQFLSLDERRQNSNIII